MEVKYFIGIVPPQEYLKRIVNFQSRWINTLGVEPHITLKAQGGLSADKKWIEKVIDVCDNYKPFQLKLGAPMYFGKTILYLSVHSNHLHELHNRIVKTISPSEELINQYFELNDFVPHLTLGKEQYGSGISTGISKIELKETEKLAEKELTPYPTFEVSSIRVYELNLEKKRYEKYKDIYLR